MLFCTSWIWVPGLQHWNFADFQVLIFFLIQGEKKIYNELKTVNKAIQFIKLNHLLNLLNLNFSEFRSWNS